VSKCSISDADCSINTAQLCALLAFTVRTLGSELVAYLRILILSRTTTTQEIASATAATAIDGRVKYGPLPNTVGYRIKGAHAYSIQTWTDMFQGLGLAWGQYSVLLLIGLNPGLSQLALAEAAGLDGSTIVLLTNRFVKLGWIRRLRRTKDRRIYSLRVTAQGQAILDRAQAVLKAHDDGLCATLTGLERSSLLQLLSKITDGQGRGPKEPFSRVAGAPES
jgi:DNA-binding MarR family transcriptional regulator